MSKRKIVLMKGDCGQWLAVEVDQKTLDAVANLLSGPELKPVTGVGFSPDKALKKLEGIAELLEKAKARAMRLN